MPESKAIQRLQEKMAGIQAGTVRYEALEAARRFKSSWIELGRVLWTVHRERKFREWGYLTFEGYCAKEIGIRPATAKKLLHSYYFLEREEPTLLRNLSQEPPAQHPSVEAVNVLRLLKNRKEVPEEGYQRVRSYVLEKGKDPAEVRREARSLIERHRPDGEEREQARRQARLRRMVGTMRMLRRELEEQELAPKKLLDEIEALAKRIEGLLA